MQFINAQNVKNLAKEYGKEIRGQDTNVGSDFLIDIDRLVEQCVKQAVRSQPDSKRITLQSCDWITRKIKSGEEVTENYEPEVINETPRN